MPVGHGGDMSKHPAWEKIALLELLEQRLKWAAIKAGLNPDKVHVYDPFTTDMDFYIFFEEASWEDYLQIYRWYYDESLPAYEREEAEYVEVVEEGIPVTARTRIPRVLKDINISKLPSSVYETYEKALTKAIDTIKTYDDKEIFNASTSKTMILYTVEEMKNILQYGTPNPP